MKKMIMTVVVGVTLVTTPIARADLFGGDVVVLSKILFQTIQQLAQLRRILKSSRQEFNLIADINRGINDSLHLLKTIDPHLKPGVFGDLKNIGLALRELERVYGKIPNSKAKSAYQMTDQSIAEALVFNNEAYRRAKTIDNIGEEIKSYSHRVSPGGAQKLTAQSMGVLLHVENHQLRAQTKAIKLQAQALARQNQKDKEKASEIQEAVKEITKALDNQQRQQKFQIPRF